MLTRSPLEFRVREFVSKAFEHKAWENVALPIG